VSEGIEKKVLSQAAGEAAPIDASFVNVTVSVPLAATVRGDVSECELPEVPVAKLHPTALVEVEHPVWAVESAEVVNPPAYVTLVGRLTAVRVTGNPLGFVIVATTSPVPPGKRRLVAAGEATAVIERFATAADCASPDEPPARPTSQLVAANAVVPTSAAPTSADTTRVILDVPRNRATPRPTTLDLDFVRSSSPVGSAARSLGPVCNK
jgi:hypothetical protein